MRSSQSVENFRRKKTDRRAQVEREVVFLAFNFASDLEQSVFWVELRLPAYSSKFQRAGLADGESACGKIDQHIVVAQNSRRNVDLRSHARFHYAGRIHRFKWDACG